MRSSELRRRQFHAGPACDALDTVAGEDMLRELNPSGHVVAELATGCATGDLPDHEPDPRGHGRVAEPCADFTRCCSSMRTCAGPRLPSRQHPFVLRCRASDSPSPPWCRRDHHVRRTNVSLDLGVQDALYTAEVCGANAQVYAGAAAPIMRELHTAQNMHGADGMPISDCPSLGGSRRART